MKKWRSLLALVLAAVLTLGTAVTAMAAGYTPPETATVHFQLGRAMAVLADPVNKTLEGYQLMTVEPTLMCDDEEHTHEDSCYAYVYTVNEKYRPFMVEAVNAVQNNAINSDAEATKQDEALLDWLDKNRNDADEVRDFADALWRAIKENNEDTTQTKVGPDKESIVLSGNKGTVDVLQGYWLFVDVTEYPEGTTGVAMSPVLLDTKGETNLTVTTKEDVPTIDKKVQNGGTDENPTYGENNAASVGEDVNFKLTSKVPNMTGYGKYYFIVTDTLSKGLDFKADSVKITIGDTPLTACTSPTDADHVKAHGTAGSTCDADYMVTSKKEGDTTVVQIIFMNFIQWADNVKDEITITYSATLTENADRTDNGNDNKVQLQYSNNPYIEDEGDPNNPDIPEKDDPTGKTPERQTHTYTASIELTKDDAKNNPLAGATFRLTGDSVKQVHVTGERYVELESGESTEGIDIYYKLATGAFTTTPPTPDTEELYADASTQYKKVTEAGWITESNSTDVVVTTGSSGVIRFEGLGDGIYQLEELEAPAGYNKLSDPLYINISFDMSTKAWSAVFCDESGNTLSGAETITANGNQLSFSVENHTGTELPETGGIGTTVFYVAGVLLVLGAGALLLRKKRWETK